jgi:hypothetical protein
MGAGIIIIMLGLLLALAIGFSIAVLVRKGRIEAELQPLKSERDHLNARMAEATQEIQFLAKYRHIVDVEHEIRAAREGLYREQQAVQQGLANQTAAAEYQVQAAREVVAREHQEAQHWVAAHIAAAQHQAATIVADANQHVEAARQAIHREQQEGQQALTHQTVAAQHEIQAARAALYREREDAQRGVAAQIAAAQQEAATIISNANQRAEVIAGNALDAKEKVEVYRREAQALKNVIDGYGDRYLVPTHSVLDDLAEAFGFTEAGQSLKNVRQLIRQMVKDGRAATCEYVEANRRETAIVFVVDAFNGKVDTVLSGVKAENVGTLQKKSEMRSPS